MLFYKLSHEVRGKLQEQVIIMIANLRGILLESQLDYVVLDVNGVGYEIQVHPRVSSGLPSLGEVVSLIIYTDVRENAIILFGFSSTLERQIFLFLKKVKGIGSKLAMGILSSVEPEHLLYAIGSSDTSALLQVPGVGKKSAERIIVELREQVKEFAIGISSNPSLASKNTSDNDNGSSLNRKSCSIAEEDAALALIKLGFSEDRAFHAVTKAMNEGIGNSDDTGELVRRALSHVV
jgi:holliday junction DNA helicase RuvA